MTATAFLLLLLAIDTGPVTLPTTTPRLLAPGDVVRVQVSNQDEEMTLNPDGEVYVRGLGVVSLRGRTPDAATTDLARRIRSAGYAVDETDVVIFLVRTAPETTPPRPPAPRDESLTADSGVTVLGEVAKPGIHPPGRLTAVLAAAGGTTDRAAWRVSIRDRNGTTRTIDLYAVLRGRKPDDEIPAGAVLHVPRSVNPFTIIRDLLGIGAAVGRAASR